MTFKGGIRIRHGTLRTQIAVERNNPVKKTVPHYPLPGNAELLYIYMGGTAVSCRAGKVADGMSAGRH